MIQKNYATVIFPDHVYDEILLLKKELSCRYERLWSLSDTINLLIRFSFHEKNDLVYDQNYSFLNRYMDGKESFLQDFTLNVLRSV